ncbi:MAG: hypothetical protein GY799_32585 [Desulfobulbaceae bacterium]|nr:hypothetical protein [Desulfobulbaceae bacterium]
MGQDIDGVIFSSTCKVLSVKTKSGEPPKVSGKTLPPERKRVPNWTKAEIRIVRKYLYQYKPLEEWGELLVGRSGLATYHKVLELRRKDECR